MAPSSRYFLFLFRTLLAGAAFAATPPSHLLPLELSSGLSLTFASSPDSAYCLISDPCVHVNGLTGSSSSSSPWLRALGIRSGNHTLELWASVPYGSTHPALTRARLDDRDLTSSLAHGESASSDDKKVKIEALESGQHILVTLGQCSMRLLLRLQVKQRQSNPPAPHFLVDVLDWEHLQSPHGIIGQMYVQPARAAVNTLSLKTILMGIRSILGQPPTIDGTPADYLSSSVTAADCLFARFPSEKRLMENSFDLVFFPTGDDEVDETAILTRHVSALEETEYEETAVEVDSVTHVSAAELNNQASGKSLGRRVGKVEKAGVVEEGESVEDIGGEGIQSGVFKLMTATNEEEGSEGGVAGTLTLTKAGAVDGGEGVQVIEGLDSSDLELIESTQGTTETPRLGRPYTTDTKPLHWKEALDAQDLQIIGATQGTEEVITTQ